MLHQITETLCLLLEHEDLRATIVNRQLQFLSVLDVSPHAAIYIETFKLKFHASALIVVSLNHPDYD